MKKLFNNTWFVVGLGAFASIFLGMMLVEPLMGDDATAANNEFIPPFGSELDPLDAALTNEPVAESQDSSVRPTTTTAKAQRGAEWLAAVQRDPFGVDIAPDDSGSQDARRDLPRLGALFLGPRVRAAVLDDRLVRVGDRVGRYTVESIAEKRVYVNDGSRSFLLEPEV